MNIDFTQLNFAKVTTQTLIGGLLAGGLTYGQTHNTNASVSVFLAGLLSHAVASGSDTKKKAKRQ